MLFLTCVVLGYRTCRIAGWCVQDELTRYLLKNFSSGDMSKKIIENFISSLFERHPLKSFQRTVLT